MNSLIRAINNLHKITHLCNHLPTISDTRATNSSWNN